MTQTLDAVFEDGGFKPVDSASLPFSEGQRVKLTVEVPSETEDNSVELAGRVYEGLSEGDISEIERLALNRGNFFDDEPSARKNCAPQPQSGYCCAGGEVYPTNRAQCRGSFFTDQASARKACTAPPEQGYCCAGGKVSQTTRERCTGTFARLQEEAQRVCRRESEIRIEKDLVTKPPRDDAPR